MSNLTTFIPGDIVVSVSGDGAPGDTTSYADNQGSPITLEEINPTTGAIDGTLVLPQTASTANGVTQSAISGEYGSSSEGALQLSADGQSLVIAGYGINAVTYNNGEAGLSSSGKAAGGTYGNAALAQTYSVPNGGTNGAPTGVTVVPRVIADINYSGTVDTSTSLINIDNENNPRSVATTNGSTFYVSGQGVKGDTTQGVFVASDGANNTTPTALYTGTDTRTAELYNNTLYVSADSSVSKGTGNISSYGTSPAGATTPTPLPGITGKITLTAAQANSVNAGQVGNTVDLSPEGFYFANSTTLYVADSGNPKGGTLGAGGLQKWTLNNSTWTLNYTLSAGLGLVANTTADPGAGKAATTGLIGLTGTTNTATGIVTLYATNATIGDQNATALYTITDTLAATTAPAGESFTQLVAAPVSGDSNIRGVAFAPQALAVACFCSGTLIRTANGDVAVENLSSGDLAVTASGASRPIVWVGHRTIPCRRYPSPHEVMPIRIAAHAFGENRPARDLFVSPGHSIAVDLLGEILIPASSLINGTTIRQESVDEVTYWHVELETHDLLLSENLTTESYLEMGNRQFFVNGSNKLALHGLPDTAVGVASTHADFCRPFHADGALVDHVRSRLAARASTLGWRLAQALLDAVHLMVDGLCIRPSIRGLELSFEVPAEAKDVWLVSSAAIPSQISDSSDTRNLGATVRRIVVEEGSERTQVIAVDDPRLCDGFHGAEGTHRWTTGRARLPAEFWEGCRDAFVLRVELAGPLLPRWTAPSARDDAEAGNARAA